MSKELGPITFGKKEEQIFLGKEFAQHRDYSENTAIKIDKEIKIIVEKNYNRSKKLLEANIHILHSLAQTLLEKETLNGEEIEEIVKKGKGELKDLSNKLEKKEKGKVEKGDTEATSA
jgi:cell division protease FtsH